MNADLKAKWIAALRSGEYTQGQFRLRRKNGTFCCLGVLCDISGQGEWRHGEVASRFYAGGDSSTVSVPENLAVKIELDDAHAARLATMNDEGASFGAIADYIEREL